MKKVIVTGCSGFLGRYLTDYLLNKGVEVLALSSKQVDLTQDNAMREFVKTPHEFDTIFHLAAYTQAGTFCDTHRGLQWVVNQQINTNLLAWWKDYAPQAKMIAFGTSASYGLDNPLVESYYMDGMPYDKFYGYAMCKRMLLVGLQCLHKQYGMNYLYLVPSTLYGPNYHLDNRQPHFIYDLIRKIIRGKIHGEPVVLWGDGEQRRELIYVNDFVEIMIGLNNISSNEIFNIGGGMDYSIKEFAKLICKEVDYDFDNIQFDLSQYVGAKSKILDITKYEDVFRLPPDSITSINKGIQNTIAWFYDHKERFLQ